MSVEEQEANASNSQSTAPVTTASTVMPNSGENSLENNSISKGNEKVNPSETETLNGPSDVKESHEEYKIAIRKQIDHYFSKGNLIKDTYLRSMMNADFAVPIASISRFKRMTMICEDIKLLTKLVPLAVQGSLVCMVTADGQGLRPKFKTERNTIILREMPGNMTSIEITEIMKGCGKNIQSVWSDVGDTWFVTMLSEEDALSAMLDIRSKKITHEGQALKARLKSETGAQTMKAFLTQSLISSKQNGHKPAAPQPPGSLHGKMGPVPPRARGAPPVHPSGYPPNQPGFSPAGIPMNPYNAMGPHGGPRPQRVHMNGNYHRYTGPGPMPPGQQGQVPGVRMNGSMSNGSLSSAGSNSQLSSMGGPRPPSTPSYSSVSHPGSQQTPAATPVGQSKTGTSNKASNRTQSTKGTPQNVSNGTVTTDSGEKGPQRPAGKDSTGSAAQRKNHAAAAGMQPGGTASGANDESALNRKKKNKKDAAKQRTAGTPADTPVADSGQSDNTKSTPLSAAGVNESTTVSNKNAASKAKGKAAGAAERQSKDGTSVSKPAPNTSDILNAADFPALPRQAKALPSMSKQSEGCAASSGAKEKKVMERVESLQYSKPFVKYTMQDICRIGMTVTDSAKLREELSPETHSMVMRDSPRPGHLMPEETEPETEEDMGQLSFGSLEEKPIKETTVSPIKEATKQNTTETSKLPDKPLGAWASAVIKGNVNTLKKGAEPTPKVAVDAGKTGKSADTPKDSQKPASTGKTDVKNATKSNTKSATVLKDLDGEKKQPAVWGGKRSFLDVVKTADQKRAAAASGSA
uniref:HTH La-type RNA-binding domain-containing protein n=2 Tax=Octactis speculum TaxID=3111310 RepID=A0A7S2MRL4_9STRA|mmetsp:Transcript_8785/g.11182  ORF Transcript_8785/g.11182 Transcript_8785/m.11182 type:complete len:806 (+) Transcript_8785:239-2656(+)|eukprot:CAMPEP_0185744236 /NCGR_PEP_ID=MMETSP1174-20130828/2266_1 /TAXON_ID=35687 /ORGANISM="Dictyocha speculum, Strain CCMP1381" /LENGTH=805 /DNA_ID=CAMNT_0028417491 /DNA_START=238 /DNA_END=2655 /DNA_ORIENTATION=+